MTGEPPLPEPPGGDREGGDEGIGGSPDPYRDGRGHRFGDVPGDALARCATGRLDGLPAGGLDDAPYEGFHEGFSDPAYEALYDSGPSAMDRIRRSAPGTMLAAAMLGLGQIIEGRPPREEIAIVSEAPGEPFRRVELRLDPVHKERSLVIVHAGPPASSPGHR